MSTRVLLSIAAGLLGALPLIAMAAVPGGALLVLLAPLPLFLAGLSQGVASVAIAGATTTAVVGLDLGTITALGTLVTLAAPILILVRQALLNRPLAGPTAPGATAAGPTLEWYPPGLLVTWLTGIGLLWLAVSLAVIGSGVEGFEGRLKADVEKSLSLVAPQQSPELLAEAAGALAPIALGLGLVSWLALLAVNAVLAQGALARFGRNLRPAPDIGEIELPGWLTPALAAALLAAFLVSGDPGFIAKNLAIVLLLPFFFLGLSVVHVFVRRFQSGFFLIVTFYTLLVLFPYPAVIVVALGLLEQWLNLRRRGTPAAGSREEQ